MCNSDTTAPFPRRTILLLSKIMFRSSLLLLVSPAAFTTLLTSCGSTQLASRWTDTPVVANGHDDEWNGMILYQEKEKIGVGIANDNTNLYIVLKTLDFPT